MQLPFNTPLGFIGFLMLGLGVFLLLAGFGILNIEKVTVRPGRSTSSVGMVFALLGVASVFLADQGMGISNLLTPVATPTTAVTPTVTVTATATATATLVPSAPPATPTPVSAAPGLFSRNCFPSATWFVSPGSAGAPLKKNGCWQLPAWGWSAAEDGLSVYLQNSKATDTFGIYTPVDPYVQITFELQIDRLYSLGNAAARAFFGIVDLNEPEKGIFFILKETVDTSRAELQVGDNLKFPAKVEGYCYYGKPDTIDLMLEGPKLSIYWNGQLVSEQGITTTEPAFWIGNHYNIGGDVEWSISNLEIAGE